MDRVGVAVFAMTGLGNDVLEAVAENPGVEVLAVFTPEREPGPFPYYECEKIQDAARRKGFTLYEGLSLKDEKTAGLLRRLSPGLIIVGGFDQIIGEDIISMPRYGVVNLHPSLLPRYRGATPIFWAILNGEKKTGVTAHFIEDRRLDRGRIIAQAAIEIGPGENEGELRKRLSSLSGKVVKEALGLVFERKKESFPEQDEALASYYPKRGAKDAIIDLNMPFDEVRNRIRASTPHPGATLEYGGRIYRVRSAERSRQGAGASEKEIVVNAPSGVIKFRVG